MLVSSLKPTCPWQGCLSLAHTIAYRNCRTLARSLLCQPISAASKPYHTSVTWATPSRVPRTTSQAAPDTAQTSGQYLKPLLLAFFASQKRSLFAAECFIYTVLDLYHHGVSLDDVQLELKLAGLQEDRQINTLEEGEQAKARLLQNVEQEMLLTWVALIQLTIQELNTHQAASAESAENQDGRGQEESNSGGSTTALGMRSFVKQMLASGFDMQRLQLQQQMAEDEKGRLPPAVRLMQQNARLVILTKELTAAAESSERGARNFQGVETELPGNGRHAAAVRSLLAFIGAAQGSMFAVNAFLDEVLVCYRQGWTAQEVLDELSQERFATGQTLFPVVTAEGSGAVSASIYAQWLSVVYMALAQQGQPHAAAGDALGWGWAAIGDSTTDQALQAHRLSEFVRQTIQSQAEKDGAPQGESEAAEAVRKLGPDSQASCRERDYTIAVLKDDSLKESSSTMALVAQLIDLVVRTSERVKELQSSATS